MLWISHKKGKILITHVLIESEKIKNSLGSYAILFLDLRTLFILHMPEPVMHLHFPIFEILVF